MGLFDHLFKSKSPPAEDQTDDTGPKTDEPVKRSDTAGRGGSTQKADPSSFLHPKSFVPRGVTPLTPPAKSVAHSGVRKPGAPVAPPPPEEIVLTLGDVLSRIPTPYLKAGTHDPKREIRFSINDLSSDIARGRAAVPLSRIAQLVPDIFTKSISKDEDTEIRLPLQKLVEQIGLLRSRPQGGGKEPAPKPSGAVFLEAGNFPAPTPELATAAAAPVSPDVLQPAAEAVPATPRASEPILELKPAITAVPPVILAAPPSIELKPTNEEPAFAPILKAEAPAPVAPPVLPPPPVAVVAAEPSTVLVAKTDAPAADAPPAFPPPPAPVVAIEPAPLAAPAPEPVSASVPATTEKATPEPVTAPLAVAPETIPNGPELAVPLVAEPAAPAAPSIAEPAAHSFAAALQPPPAPVARFQPAPLPVNEAPAPAGEAPAPLPPPPLPVAEITPEPPAQPEPAAKPEPVPAPSVTAPVATEPAAGPQPEPASAETLPAPLELLPTAPVVKAEEPLPAPLEPEAPKIIPFEIPATPAPGPIPAIALADAGPKLNFDGPPVENEEPAELGGERIQLSLAALLRQCPKEIIIGELPIVPDSVRITLPFAPIDRQLVKGHVEISAVRFVAALPIYYQKYFFARMGVKVPIPLEEVFQNLPNSNPEPTSPEVSGATFLAPADPGVPLTPPMEPAAVLPPVLPPPLPQTPEVPVAPAAELPPVAPEPLEPPVAPVPLDLPVFQQFAPPPPVVAPDPETPPTPPSVAAEDKGIDLASALTSIPPLPVQEEKPAAQAAAPVDVPVAEVERGKPVDVGAPLTFIPFAEAPAVGAPVAETVGELPTLDEVVAEAKATEIPALAPEPEVQAPVVEAQTPEVVAEVAPVQESVEQPAAAPVAEPEVPPAPPSEALSAAPTVTIQPPPMIRPFIVLPPPIFAFKPTDTESSDKKEDKAQVAGGKPNGEDITPVEGSGFIAPPAEAPGVQLVDNSVNNPSDEAAPAPGAPLDAPVIDGTVTPASAAADSVERPRVISIDFSKALVPEDEDEAPAAAAPAPALVETLAPSSEVTAPPVEAEKPFELPPRPPSFVDLVLADDQEEDDTPESAEAGPTQPEVAASATEPASAFQPLFAQPPAAEATETPKVELPPLPFPPPAALRSLNVTADLPADITPAPAIPSIIPAAEAPVEVAPEAPQPPAAPEEVAPAAKAEPIPELAPAPTPAPVEPAPIAAEVAPAPADIPADLPISVAPLLSIPKFGAEVIEAEVLPPPGLPLRRFDQDALQAIFMTEEALDLTKISRLAAQLPGVHACVIATRDQACTGGTLPEGFDLAALLGLAPRVGEAAGRLPIGQLKHFTLYGERYSVSFFERNGLSLCAVHRPRSFVPGVREKLVAIADELSKS